MTKRNHRAEWEAYVRRCTDSQLRHVLADERDRAKRHKGTETGRVARIGAEEATREMERRGLSE